MPRMFYVADILEFVVDGLDECSFSEQSFVVQVHKRVLHALPDLRDKVYVVNKKSLEKILAYVTLVRKQFSEQSLGEVLVFQRFTVIRVARCKFHCIISPQSLMTMCSLNPKNQPIVFLPLAAHPLIVPWLPARLM